MEIPESMFVYSNGTVSSRDKKGNQMGDIQSQSWLAVYFDYLYKNGVDPRQIKDIQTIVNGRTVYVRPIKTENGWNVQFLDF